MRLGRALAFFGFALPVFAQFAPYDGPAVLARGQAPAAMMSPQIELRPFVEVAGVYDTGLAGVIVNDQGQLANTAGGGVELAGGISGVHSWKHTQIGLDYRGAWRHYSRSTYYDGTDQSLMLGITQQVTRHTVFSLRQSAGLFSRDFGFAGLAQTVPFDPSLSYIPTTDFFDNRTYYVSSQADFTFQKSTRLSFNLGGDGFLARRRSSSLAGVSGAGARADMEYRISRRTTVGAAYSYTHFSYPGLLSNTDLHSAVATYSVRLSRWTEFSGYAGFLRAETKFVRSVPLDPVIAAILGQTSTNILVHRIDYLPTINARLSRTFRDGVLYAGGGHSVTPGNGLFLTSRVTTVMAGYSYTGLRRWSFNSQASVNLAKSVGNVTGNYNTYAGSFSVSRQIAGAVHALVSFDVRQYDSPDFANYHKTVYRTRVGLGFSPGDIPLRLW